MTRFFLDPQRPPLLFPFARKTFGPPEEPARAASPQPHRCGECGELRRQVEDLRRENELLQVELEVARLARPDDKVEHFLATMKNKQSPAASPVLAAAAVAKPVVDLSQISFAEISELRHLRRAPPPVAKTLQALAVALNFASSEELLADASLLAKLKTFAESDTRNVWRKIRPLISDLTSERVFQCNRSAGLLFAWLLQTVRPATN